MSATPSFNPRTGMRDVPRHSVSSPTRAARSNGMLLRLIAILKFLKAASLIALSVGVFRMMHQDIGLRVERWVEAMHLDPGNRHVAMLLARIGNLNPAQIKKLGLVGLLYAGLFLVEGTGLWLQRRWGEWATVVITGLLVPVEVYEIVRRPSVVKVLVWTVNVAVVWYLLHRIRTTEPGSH